MFSELHIQEIHIAFLGLGSLASGLIAWVTFHFYSTRRFEKKFKELGVERNNWDPFIFRTFPYSLIIIFQTERLNDDNYYFFVPVSATRKLATRIDKIIAIWLWISAITMILVVLSLRFTDMAFE
jgi:hypothetical protein